MNFKGLDECLTPFFLPVKTGNYGLSFFRAVITVWIYLLVFFPESALFFGRRLPARVRTQTGQSVQLSVKVLG